MSVRVALVVTLLSVAPSAIVPRVAAQATTTARPSAAEFITRLYADYQWETKDDDLAKRAPLFSAPTPLLRRYLDTDLVRAVLRDRACQKRVEGECNLEFEPMWASQDPGGATVRVVATRDPGVVQALVRYAGDRTVTITYRLRWTTAGWRIADIGNPDVPSLLARLRRPVQ